MLNSFRIKNVIIQKFILLILIFISFSCTIRHSKKTEITEKGYNPFTNQTIDTLSLVFHLTIRSEHFSRTLYAKGNLYFKEGDYVINIYSPLFTGLTSIYQLDDILHIYESFNNQLYVFEDYSGINLMNINLSFFIKGLNYILKGNNSIISADMIEPNYDFIRGDEFLDQIISPDYQIITFENYSLISAKENIFFPSDLKIYDTLNQAMIEIDLKNIRTGVNISDDRFVIPIK